MATDNIDDLDDISASLEDAKLQVEELEHKPGSDLDVVDLDRTKRAIEAGLSAVDDLVDSDTEE